MPVSAETVGAFTTEPADSIAGSSVTASEEQAQNVSTAVFIMISGFHTVICQEFMQKKIDTRNKCT